VIAFVGPHLCFVGKPENAAMHGGNLNRQKLQDASTKTPAAENHGRGSLAFVASLISWPN
jgi:hypothetical protein